MSRGMDEYATSQIRDAWSNRRMDTYEIGVMLRLDEWDVERAINRYMDDRWRLAADTNHQ